MTKLIKKFQDPNSRITTSGNGYVPPVNVDLAKLLLKRNLRLIAYKYINPMWMDYDLFNDLSIMLSYRADDYYKNARDNDKVGDNIFAEYLQIPELNRRFKNMLKPSKYKPSHHSYKGHKIYSLPIDEYHLTPLILLGVSLPENTSDTSFALADYNLGKHTVSHERDKNGEYVSYYDKWDVNPFTLDWNGTSIDSLYKKGDIGLGKPPILYDRIYLDDYYDIPKNLRGTGKWLPEIQITK